MSYSTGRLVPAFNPQRGQFPTHGGAVAEPDQLSAKRAVATARGDPLNKGKNEAISTKKTLDFFAGPHKGETTTLTSRRIDCVHF